MYMTPSSKRHSGPPPSHPPEGPISDLLRVIESTKSEQWQQRTQAFQKLVDSIPIGSTYIEQQNQWFNTPTTLRHLAYCINELLKDPRSTVVKKTCTCLTMLFQKCQSDARYLFKDIMATILSVHAQTVQIIRQSVLDMSLQIIPECPCKMAMPLWIERLKMDKSRTVREACVQYLGQALKSWTEEGYLTVEIWHQVGRALIKSARDPSPAVRQYTKQTLQEFQDAHPEIYDDLVNDSDFSRDPKLHRWLTTLGQQQHSNAEEELSVHSRFSYNNDIRVSASVRSSPSAKNIPTNIAVRSTEQPKRQGGLGPPLRRNLIPGSPGSRFVASAAAAQSSPQAPVPVKTPPRPPPINTNMDSPDRSIHDHQYEDEIPPSDSFPNDLTSAFRDAVNVSSSTPHSQLTNDSPSTMPSLNIVSKEELKNQASMRRSRNSLMMQERFRMTSLGDSEEAEAQAQSSSNEENMTPRSSAPEHMVLAIRLLRAHKEHVDLIMETLRVEMDTLRDFDKLLEMAGRPTEEEVIDYFEGVGLCLEQRMQSGGKLQAELERISRGEPPLE